MFEDIALKAFVTGLCKTAGSVIVLGLSWKLFVATGNDRILSKARITEQNENENNHSDHGEDSEIEIILNNLNSDSKYKKLFDRV
jgi:hypothetical protein